MNQFSSSNAELNRINQMNYSNAECRTRKVKFFAKHQLDAEWGKGRAYKFPFLGKTPTLARLAQIQLS